MRINGLRGWSPTVRAFTDPRSATVQVVVLRSLGLGLGFLATLAFYAVGAEELPTRTFAVLIVAMNCALLIQALDFGVGARFVTGMSEFRSQSSAPFPATSFLLLNAAVALFTTISASAIYLTSLVSTGSFHWQEAIAGVLILLGALFAASSATGLAALIACERLRLYYAAALTQPGALLVISGLLAVIEKPSLLLFGAAFALSSVTPSAVGLLLSRHTQTFSVRIAHHVGEAGGHLKMALPIGLSQVAGSVLYVGLPSLIALAGSLSVVATYGFSLRIYSAFWSLLATIHVSLWPETARANVDGDFATVLSIARRANRQGFRAGSAAMPLFATLFIIAHATGHAPLLPSPIVTLAVAAAVWLRAAFIGEVLIVSVRGLPPALLVVQWAVAGALVTATLLLGKFVYAPAILVCAATLVDGIAMIRWNRRVLNNCSRSRSSVGGQ